MSTRREFLAQVAGAAAATLGAARIAQGSEIARHPGSIQTVQGVIEASQLGFTLPHEHVCASSADFWQARPEFFGGRATYISRIVAGLKAARDEGVATIVDVTPVDIGRDIRLLEELSRKSGMQIVASTGHWLLPSLSMAARTADELAAVFVREIEHGIGGSDIKAGVIKVASDPEGVTPFLERTLRAAARASMATGVPVTTHTCAAAFGREKQADIFESEGLSPQSVCLGHAADSDDVQYLTGLLKRGYTIGVDHLTGARAKTVKQLTDSGFDRQVLLANDGYFGICAQKLNPDGMLFTRRKVIPYLQVAGVTEQQIRAMTVDNPRRFFARS